MTKLMIKNKDIKGDMIYDEQHFINLGKKLARESIANLRKELREDSENEE